MKTRIEVAFAALVLAVLLSSRPDVLAAQEARLAGRLPDAERAQIDAIVNAARGAGLPTEPLVDRALEGAAKRAPADLIVGAVLRLRDELRVARNAFGEMATAAELTAGASALRAGASAENLAHLRELRPGQPLTMAAAVLADLVAAGVPADTGIAAVLALAPVAPDAEYVTFRRNVERDIALGASPAASIGVRLRAAGAMADVPGTQTGSGSTPRKRKP